MKTIDVLLATPYGEFVNAKRNTDPKDPDCLLDAEAVARMSGIYDPGQRARFKAEFGRVKINQAYLRSLGGHPVPSISLPPISEPIAPRLDRLHDKSADEHRRLIVTAPGWPERADRMLKTISVNLDGRIGLEIVAVAIAAVNDGALERLRERDIRCLEAAIFYSFSSHESWRDAGNRWLAPFVDTWLKDWLRDRPKVVEFAELLKRSRPSAATWLKV